MIPTRERLEERRHEGYRIYGYFYSFCALNSCCENCERLIRLGCEIKRGIEELQTKRILRICKSGKDETTE